MLNVVFLLTDHLSAQDLGILGNKQVITLAFNLFAK
jgi:hypothetical protein